MSVYPEAIAASALRDWLLMQLPAKVAALNASRPAVLRTPAAGPYTIPAAASLKVSVTDKAGATTTIALTSGSRTAAELATEINASVASLAAADSDGRLVLTATSTPSGTTPSVMAVGPDATGANEALGFDVAGDFEVRTALASPTLKGVCDGLPLQGYFDPSAAGAGRILVTIGDREAVPVQPSTRRDQYDVTLDVGIFRAEPLQLVHRNREAIEASVQAVREVLLSVAGRQLGRAGNGDVVVTLEKSCRIAGKAMQFRDTAGQAVSPIFDAANLKLLVRVFGRPS